MKKILNILVIFLIFLIVLMPNISKADEHSDIIEQINNIYSDFNSGNIKAYKSLSVDLIGKAFDYNDDNLVTEIMRILGENTGTEPKLLITSEEEANLYVSLVNKLKSDLDTFPVLANYVLTTIGGDTYNLYLNNMEERSKYAQETDFSEEGENTGDNENNNGNNNGNTGNEDGEIDNIFDLEWDEISEETYAGDGLTTIGEAQELYKKLQAVDYDALSDEDKAKWDSRYEKLTSWMNANYPGSVEITEDKYDKPIYNNPLINQGGTATATEVTPDKIID